ncbi:MAG: hypothetical protein HDR55_04310 [Treponema sp.]|nr:hypothetical protein [Treponema sp.]
MKLFSLLKSKEGLKTATKLALLFLMASFFQNSLINCDFSLRYEIAFSAIQKLKLFSLLKIKEGLKTATKLALLFLMASFFQNSLINCDFSLHYEIAFSAIQKLKLLNC